MTLTSKKEHLFVWIKIGVHALQKLFLVLFPHYRKSSQYSIAVVAFLGIRKYKLGRYFLQILKSICVLRFWIAEIRVSK